MSIDKGTFEALVPSRFITFTCPNPFSSRNATTTTHYHLDDPLLRVAVMDSPTRPTADPPRIAAMIVPNDRETDWTFSTKTGHLQLLFDSPDISRLILIGNFPSDIYPTTFNRPIPIDPIHRSKLEESLNPLLFALSPKLAFRDGLPEIPILSYEDDVIRSVIVERRLGSCVGELLVEDVELEGVGEAESNREFRRRLRFKRMPNLIQTQVRIAPTKTSDITLVSDTVSLDDLEFCLDMARLVHPYLIPMVASLSLISSQLEQRIRGGFRPKAFVLGVGGGALLTFLNTQLGFEVRGVEADETVLGVARQHFGLQDSKHVCVYVGDGIKLMKELAEQAQNPNSDSSGVWSENNGCCSENLDRLDAEFDVIMVDLDSNEAGVGTMAPPLEFVQKPVLLSAKMVLSEHGILVVNVIPSNKSFYEKLVCEFGEIFEELYEIDVGNGENFVLIATASRIGFSSGDSENYFLEKLKLVISGAYLDSIRKI